MRVLLVGDHHASLAAAAVLSALQASAYPGIQIVVEHQQEEPQIPRAPQLPERLVFLEQCRNEPFYRGLKKYRRH